LAIIKIIGKDGGYTTDIDDHLEKIMVVLTVYISPRNSRGEVSEKRK